MSFYLCYYIARASFDADYRYRLFVRFPNQMRYFEQYRAELSATFDVFLDKNIGEIPVIKTESDYFNFKEGIKDRLFHRKEKQLAQEQQRLNLVQSKDDIETQLKDLDALIKQEDRKILAQIHKREAE